MKWNVLVSSCAALLNVILNILSIPYWGIEGAAAATLVSYMCVIGISLWIGRRWMVAPWPVGDSFKAALGCLAGCPLMIYGAQIPNIFVAIFAIVIGIVISVLVMLLVNYGSFRRSIVDYVTHSLQQLIIADQAGLNPRKRLFPFKRFRRGF